MPEAVSENDFALAVIEAGCAVEDMGDEIVALNIGTGIYFSIRGAGVALWRDLAAGHSVAALSAIVQEAHGNVSSLNEFVAKAQEHGLMMPAAVQNDPGTPALADVLAKGEREFVFDVFDDMQDLILSDPVHDFDGTAGWPFRPEK